MVRTDKIVNKIKQGAATFAEWVYPANIYCISCGAPVFRDALYSLCDECLAAVTWANKNVCEKCGKLLEDWYPDTLCSDCKNIKHVFDSGITCTQYNQLERELIKDFKYHGKSYMARKMSEIMADRLYIEELFPDMIVSVPMYKAKEKKRGYNQAALLAKYLAKTSGLVYHNDILLRIKNTEPMNQLNAKTRHENVSDAFAVKKSKFDLINGMKILLIDDIFTTGATADACSAVLKKAGASEVYLMSFSAGINQRILPEVGQNNDADV